MRRRRLPRLSLDGAAALIGWSGRVDAALDRARTQVDEAARRAAYAAAAAIYLPTLHRLHLVHENWRFAVSSRITGFRLMPDGVIRVQDLRLE